MDEEMTSGTSDFEESTINEPDDCYCESFDIELIKGWRVTYQGIGIYEALKNAMFEQTGSSNAWISFINSDACNWLPKPPSYGNDNKSFFTEKGFNRFDELVLPIIAQYIDQTKIYIEEIMVPTNQIVYSDEFQFVTSDTIQESTIPRSNTVYTTGQIIKIEDFPFDKAYFGSPNKLPSTMKLDGPFFITPYFITSYQISLTKLCRLYEDESDENVKKLEDQLNTFNDFIKKNLKEEDDT